MENLDRQAFVLVKDKYLNKNVVQKNDKNNSFSIFSNNKWYDGSVIYYIIKSLQKFQYKIRLITPSEYSRLSFDSACLIIFPHNYISGELENDANIVRAKENGCNMIFTHHHGVNPYKYLDFYDKKFFNDKVSYSLVPNSESLLVEGLDLFIKGLNITTDEFSYISKPKFITLVEKTSQKNDKFVCFGYSSLPKGNFIFLIDLHRVGGKKDQGEFFDILINNTLSFLTRTPSIEVGGSTTDLSEPPERIVSTVNRIIRDTVKTKKLKEKYKHRCQICNERIERLDGRFYSEVHHIRPLGGGHAGLDEFYNMLVLCPTHHAMFDLGIPYFQSKTSLFIGSQNINIKSQHDIDECNVSYHNNRLRRF